MNRRFYNYTCTISRASTITSRGSLVESKAVVYQNIKCALWKASRSYGNSTLGIQTDSNNYEVNLAPQYPVNVGDIIETEIGTFKIDQVIQHHDHRGKLENHQVFVSATTK